MPDFSLNAIGQIHITISDIDRTVTFYRDVLGMKFLFQVPGQPMAFFDCGGVRLYFGKAESPEFRSSPLMYYRVDDLQAAVSTLEERGVTFSSPPHVVHRDASHALWMAGFADPDGNQILLMAEVPVAG